MDPQLLTYYEAIERASADMLAAARAGDWDQVVKLEGACVLLISQLKQAAEAPAPEPQDEMARIAAHEKSRIMQRILVNDAEIRQLAEPWLGTLDDAIEGRSKRVLH
jgi:flagellar protein FliT